MSSVNLLYNQELIKQASFGFSGLGVTFESENEEIKNLLVNCASKLGAHESEELIFTVDITGTKLSAKTKAIKAENEKLLAVCCFNEMKNGKDVAVPYDAPAYLDSLATACGRKVYRYLRTPADDSDSAARNLASKQIFVRDGLFLAIKLLSLMKEKECSLEQLIYELPEKYIVRKTVSVGFSPSYLSALFGGEDYCKGNGFEGIRIVKEAGRLLIIPQRSGESIKIFAEADTMETAEELCADIEDIIASAEDKYEI